MRSLFAFSISCCLNFGQLHKIRPIHRSHPRRTGLSRNTVRRWLRQPEVSEPKYPKRRSASKVDRWAELLISVHGKPADPDLFSAAEGPFAKAKKQKDPQRLAKLAAALNG